MPTGFTAAIADGISFNDFVMQCARAMGALINIRDQPMSAPIPERFEPSDYYLRQIEAEQHRLDELRAMSDEDAELAAKKEHDDLVAYNTSAIARTKALRTKYLDMIEKVKAWAIPTPAHQEFKNFMLGQLNQSLRFDCDTTYIECFKHEQQSGTVWRQNEIEQLERNLASHQKAHREEVFRTEQRNAWLKALRESLA